MICKNEKTTNFSDIDPFDRLYTKRLLRAAEKIKYQRLCDVSGVRCNVSLTARERLCVSQLLRAALRHGRASKKSPFYYRGRSYAVAFNDIGQVLVRLEKNDTTFAKTVPSAVWD